MDKPVNVSVPEPVDVLTDFLNPSILDMLQFSIAASPTTVVIRLKNVPDCKRWVEVERYLSDEGKAVIQFHDADQPRTSRGMTFSSVKMKLHRTKEQMPQAVEMMALYMRQGVGALYKYPEVLELLKAAIQKTSAKLAKNSISGARVPPAYRPGTIDKKE